MFAKFTTVTIEDNTCLPPKSKNNIQKYLLVKQNSDLLLESGTFLSSMSYTDTTQVTLHSTKRNFEKYSPKVEM